MILTDETAIPLIENKISSGYIELSLFFDNFIFMLLFFHFLQKNIFISKSHTKNHMDI